MPKARRAKGASARAAALAALSQLAKKGVYAAPLEAAASVHSAFGVFRLGERPSPPLTVLSADAVADLCRLEWIAADPQTGHYLVTSSGIAELRRARSAPTPLANRRTQASLDQRKPTIKPARTADRPPHESALAWLRRRKDKDGQPLISEPQFNAGERLAADFWHAQMSPRVTADWSATAAGRRMRRSAPGAGIDLNDNVVAARTRVHHALRAVGPELAGILVDVCCHDVGLETAGRNQGWPQRAAKVVLQLALTALARHYGLLPPGPAPGARRLRHWGDADYRPTLDAWRS
jgi:hypothetical protein